MRNTDIGGSLRQLGGSHSCPSARRLLRTSAVLTVMAIGMQACGDERAASSPTDPPGPIGTFTLTAAPTTVSILKGGGGEARLAVVRNGFTGSVSFTVTGAPAGLAARIDPSNTMGTTATLVVSTDSAVATGIATLTITAASPGWIPQTATVDISIAPIGAFTLTAVPTTVSILKGGGGEARLAVVRSGFSGSVSLAVTGAPAGLVASIDPSNTTGTTAILVVSTDSTVTAGTATLTITAVAPGSIPQTAAVDISITPRGNNTGNVTVDFSKCSAVERPIWFAYQNGSGPWTQVLGEGDVFRFDVTSVRGGYAFVKHDRTYSGVEFATQAELTRAPIERCRSRTLTKSVSGKVVGLGPNEVVYLGMGGPNPDPEGGPISTSFALSGLAQGPLDLIAYRSSLSLSAGSERVIIRRDQDIADGGTVDDIDFTNAESFVPATARLSVTGAGSEPVSHFMGYHAGAGCLAYDLYDHPNSGTNLTMRGIPPAQQRTTDSHRVGVYTSAGGYRSASEFFHTLADRVVALPAALPVPTITTLPSAHKRIQAALTLPAEYHSGPLQLLMYAYEGQGSTQKGWFNFVTATSAWLGSPNVTLAVPDFSGVSGWRSSFLPAANVAGGWIVAAHGTNSAGASSACMSENARWVYAQVSGQR